MCSVAVHQQIVWYYDSKLLNLISGSYQFTGYSEPSCPRSGSVGQILVLFHQKKKKLKQLFITDRVIE